MTWKFHVHATEQRRLYSRILQILESQMVSIRSFAGEANDAEVCVTFVVSSEQDKAYRIEALLHRLEDIPACPFSTRGRKYLHTRSQPGAKRLYQVPLSLVLIADQYPFIGRQFG